MNKFLRLSTLALAASLLIITSCSDGKDGRQGPDGGQGPIGSWDLTCSTELVGNTVAVICGGVDKGTLAQGGKGDIGDIGNDGPTCTATKFTAGAGGWNVSCNGGPSFQILNGEDGIGASGGCTLEERGKALIIVCGEQEFRMSLCGREGTEWVSPSSASGASASSLTTGHPPQTFNDKTHFCTTDGDWADVTDKDERVLARCGANGEDYDITKQYCARDLAIAVSRSLSETVKPTSDLIEDAYFVDADPNTPFTNKWKVLDTGSCFSGSTEGKCSDFGAVAFTGVKLSIAKLNIAGSAAEELDFGEVDKVYVYSGCGKDALYDSDIAKCVVKANIDANCSVIMSGDNTCRSKSVPTTGVLVKACKLTITANENVADGALGYTGVTDKNIWYDPATVSGCDETKRNWEQAIRCVSSDSRVVSLFQMGVQTEGSSSSAAKVGTKDNSGTTYDKRVYCYKTAAQQKCDEFSQYDNTPGSASQGQCVLKADYRTIETPTGYEPLDSAYFYKLCLNYITGDPEFLIDGTAAVNKTQRVLSTATPKETGKTTYAKDSLPRAFARACVGAVLLDSKGSNPKLFTCEGEGGETNKTAWSVKESVYWGAALATGTKGTSSKIDEADVITTAKESGDTLQAKLIDMCKIVNKAYLDNAGKYMVSKATPTCPRDTKFNNDIGGFGLCIDNRKKSIAMEAPSSGYGNTVVYRKTGDTAYVASVSTAMCPLNYVHPSTHANKGLCGVSPTSEQPVCPHGYSFNKDFTKIDPKQANGGLCTYNISNADCPYGYTWNANGNECRQAGKDPVDPICTYEGKTKYSIAKDNKGDYTGEEVPKGLCVLYPSSANCPKAEGVTLFVPAAEGSVARCELSGSEVQPKCLKGILNGSESEEGTIATYNSADRSCTIAIYETRTCAVGPAKCEGLFADVVEDDTERKYLVYATAGKSNAEALCTKADDNYVPFRDEVAGSPPIPGTLIPIRGDGGMGIEAQGKCTPKETKNELDAKCGALDLDYKSLSASSLASFDIITDDEDGVYKDAHVDPSYDSKIYLKVCAVEGIDDGVFCKSNLDKATNFTSISKILTCEDDDDVSIFGNKCETTGKEPLTFSRSGECVLENMTPQGCVEGELNIVTGKCEIL